MVVAPSTEVRYVARVSNTEADELRTLHESAPRVHKSLPENHPHRKKSRELSEMLTRLHRRGVPIDILADILGVTHQAVRARVNSTPLPPSTPNMKSAKLINDVSVLTKSWASDLVLVSDTGMLRRLLVHPDPVNVVAAQMMRDVPAFMKREGAVEWLESYSDVVTGSAPSSTPLRTPPAVYMPKPIADEVLTVLTPGS
jgi:hypothetical protein